MRYGSRTLATIGHCKHRYVGPPYCRSKSTLIQLSYRWEHNLVTLVGFLRKIIVAQHIWVCSAPTSGATAYFIDHIWYNNEPNSVYIHRYIIRLIYSMQPIEPWANSILWWKKSCDYMLVILFYVKKQRTKAKLIFNFCNAHYFSLWSSVINIWSEHHLTRVSYLTLWCGARGSMGLTECTL